MLQERYFPIPQTEMDNNPGTDSKYRILSHENYFDKKRSFFIYNLRFRS
ncbi:MAG: hypothetical protein R2771_07670 [Saprospiraceae bacterium]